MLIGMAKKEGDACVVWSEGSIRGIHRGCWPTRNFADDLMDANAVRID
jgi:hypothetical protein